MIKSGGYPYLGHCSTEVKQQDMVSDGVGRPVNPVHNEKHKADCSVQSHFQSPAKKPRLTEEIDPLDAMGTHNGTLEGEREYFHEEMSLREWLCTHDRVVDAITNLHIFRQVLQYVDLAHSQGVILRNIRPSCLTLSSLHRVTFMNSSSSRSSSERSSERSTGRAYALGNLSSTKKRAEGSAGYSEKNTAIAESRPKVSIVQSRSSNKQISGSVDRHGSNAVTGTQQVKNKGYCTNATVSSQQMSFAADSKQENFAHVLAGTGAGKGSYMIRASASRAEQNEEEENTFSSLSEFSAESSQSLGDIFPLRQALLMEQEFYTSPEEHATGTSSFAADFFCLGVLLFELYCSFSMDAEWSRSMSDLRHRVLSPKFLSGHPKEAALCLWLLHPEPGSRPAAKDLLQCELLKDAGDALAEREAATDLEEKSSDADLLLGFLLRLQHLKEGQAKKLSKDVACLKADIKEVENRRSALRQRATNKRKHLEEILNFYETQEQDNATDIEESGRWLDRAQSKSARLMSNFSQLEKVYFTMRWQIDPSGIESGTSSARQDIGLDGVRSGDQEGGSTRRMPPYSPSCLQDGAAQSCPYDGNTNDHLGYFFDSLCKYARYSQFKVKACLRHGELLSQGNMIFSLSFDRDAEYFAAAGVCKKIKVFECDAVLNEHVDIHYPVVEMACGSKISSVCWNSYIKNYIASSDYEGVVQLWDTTMSQTLMEYKEHKKRVWSVDFSHADPTKLASGSDDFSVKIWSINQVNSIGTIKTTANICCVQFAANSPHLLACGSADYKVYYFDLRKTKDPLCMFGGHKKAVSYVRFMDPTTIVSASTDNTLKLWNLDEASKSGGGSKTSAVTYTGHTNEKNFVGLAAADDYIACGSETNEVFAYHKSIPIPVTSHKFGASDPVAGQPSGVDNNPFISSVCWRGKSQTLVAANSVGVIKLLELF